MSVLSDDTDVLLLIPPDFFSVASDTEEDSFFFNKAREQCLVSDLISQVNDLEGRVCHIENHGMTNQEKIMHNESLQHARHFGSADALNASSNHCHTSSRSTQSTPLKTQTLPRQHRKKWRDHLNLSPCKTKCANAGQRNMLVSDDYLSKREKDDSLLKEINMFFKERESFQGEANPANRNLPQSASNSGDCSQLSTTVFNLNKVNDLLKQLEETQAEIELKLKAKGLADQVKDHGTEVPGKHSNLDCATPVPERLNLWEALKTLERRDYANALNSDSPRAGDEVEPKKLPPDVSRLLSLSKLWAHESSKKPGVVTSEDDFGLLRQKYQEEFYRRQHCEGIIQKLQVRMLEDEQKMAVAMRVDSEKDEIISKLTEGWNNVAEHWRLLESQSKSIERETAAERERFAGEVDAARKTVARFETELSKALDLAHGYKDKCEALEEENKRLRAKANDEANSFKSQMRDLERKFLVDKGKSEKLLADTEKKLSEAKATIQDMQNVIQDNKKCLREHQNQLDIVRVERERLSDKLREEKKRVSTLEHTNKMIIQNCEELKKKEKCLKDNVKVLNEQMDRVKMDLKEFYQAQVEQIVQEKLREFQEQLSVAEKTLHKEIEGREKRVAETAVKQVQQIVEKHVVEVNLLEEKHREEIELWKVKVFRSEEKVADLQRKLDQHSSHKSEIAQKLQSIMQVQWQEALKIITASSPQSFKSPLASCKDSSLSRQNTFTMVSNMAANVERDADPAFSQEGQLTCRPGVPASSDPDVDPNGGDSLRKYIRMLLERPPGEVADITGEASSDGSAFPTAATCNLLQWQQILSECSARDNQKPMQNAVDLRLRASEQNHRSPKMRYIFTGGQVVPKQCKYGPRPAEGLVLGDLEWWSVTDHLVKEQRERETAAVQRAKEDAKKEVSFQMTKNWSNTLASVKTLSEQKRIEKREKEKQDKIDKYNEIMKNRNEEKKLIMEEMKKVLAENKESSKLVKSGLFLSLVMQERGEQIAMKKTLVDEEKRENMELGKKFKAEADEYEKEKLNEKMREKMKKKMQKEDLDKQMADINKRKKEADEELAREKQDLINMRVEEEKIRHCNWVEKNYRKEFAAKYIKKSQYQIEHEHKMRLEQEEEDEINNIYIAYEKRFQKERKEKEREALKNKVEEREKASQKLADKLREISEKEEERLDAAVREKAALANQGSEERLRRKAAAIAVILEEKKKSDEAEARKKHEEKEGVKWDVIQACRTAEVNEGWRADLRARARARKDDIRAVYDEQCRQRTENQAKQAKELEKFEEDLAKSHEEDDKYGQRALDFVAKHGMATYPVLAAIAKMKKMNGTWKSNEVKDHESSERKSKQELLGSGCYCFKC